MGTDSLENRIVRKDWSVVQVAQNFSSDQHRTILPLLTHDEPEVRELVLNCLNAVGGTVAREGLTRALRDNDEVIRARASQFLHNHLAPGLLTALMTELKENHDEYVREHAALLIGKIGDSKVIPFLQGCLKDEGLIYTRRAIILALARLGDPPSQTEFLESLHDEVPGRVAEGLDDFPYVNEPRLAPALRPFLDDLRNAVNVGMSHSPIYVRVCDVAVTVLGAVMNHPFAFRVRAGYRYSETELAEAKRLLQKV